LALNFNFIINALGKLKNNCAHGNPEKALDPCKNKGIPPTHFEE
jgi:hypothetical protein